MTEERGAGRRGWRTQAGGAEADGGGAGRREGPGRTSVQRRWHERAVGGDGRVVGRGGGQTGWHESTVRGEGWRVQEGGERTGAVDCTRGGRGCRRRSGASAAARAKARVTPTVWAAPTPTEYC